MDKATELVRSHANLLRLLKLVSKDYLEDAPEGFQDEVVDAITKGETL